jgi:hypothetical protein
MIKLVKFLRIVCALRLRRSKGALSLLDEYQETEETEVDYEGSKSLLADSNAPAIAACALLRFS